MPAADGGSGDSLIRKDTNIKRDHDPGQGDAACVRPPGGCFGPQDCPAGHDCKGCFADPCCPMCAVCYGKCVPSGECWKSSDCQSGEFCNFEGGDCGKTKPGRCEPRPAKCSSVQTHPPHCGCDGKTYPNTCLAHSAGVSVESKGPCDMKQCEAINASYLSAVKSAKVCCAMCDAIQCTHKVNASLACCCCPTYVNTVPASLKTLEKQWNDLGCQYGPWPCNPGPCPKASPYNCVPATSGGFCQD